MKRLHAAAANGTGDAGASGAMGAEALKQQMQQLQRDTDAQIADLQVQALTLLRAKERESVCVCVCVCVCVSHWLHSRSHGHKCNACGGFFCCGGLAGEEFDAVHGIGGSRGKLPTAARQNAVGNAQAMHR